MPSPDSNPQAFSAVPGVTVDEFFDLSVASTLSEEGLDVDIERLKAGMITISTEKGDEIAKIALGTLEKLLDTFPRPAEGGMEVGTEFPSLEQIEQFRSAYVTDYSHGIEEVTAERIVKVFTKRQTVLSDVAGNWPEESEEELFTVKAAVVHALALVRTNQIAAFVASPDVDASSNYDALLYAIENNVALETVELPDVAGVSEAAEDFREGRGVVLPATERPARAPYKGDDSTALARIEDVEPEAKNALGLPSSQLGRAIITFSLSGMDVDTLADATGQSPLSGQHALVLMEKGHTPEEIRVCAALNRRLDTGDDEESTVGRIAIREVHEGGRMTDAERVQFEADVRLLSMDVVKDFIDSFGFVTDGDDPELEDDLAVAIEEAVNQFSRSTTSNVETALRRAIQSAKEAGITTWPQFRETYIAPRPAGQDADDAGSDG